MTGAERPRRSAFRLVRLAFGGLLLLACGARTGLEEEPVAGSGGQSDGGASGSAGAPSAGAPSAGAPSAGAPAGGTFNSGGGGAGGAPFAGGGSGGSPIALTLKCPTGPDDTRLPQFPLGIATPVDGTRFVFGPVAKWHWDLVREDCDAVVANPEFVLQGADLPQLTFQALRPSPYHFVLTVVGVGGDTGSCKFEIPTQNRGMRVELCWNTSQDADLDLYLHNSTDKAPWYAAGSTDIFSGLNGTTCNVANCTANLRLGLTRANFGYPDSPRAYCEAGPSAAEFKALGRCPNPRTGEDNNQTLATGVAERVQLDNPTDGQTFRVMVQNFSNNTAEPHVFAYCAGKKVGEALPPKLPVGFTSPVATGFGVMWRAAEVTPHVSADGTTTSCSITFPASPGGVVPYVTINDPRY